MKLLQIKLNERYPKLIRVEKSASHFMGRNAIYSEMNAHELQLETNNQKTATLTILVKQKGQKKRYL
jgi:hypothetical protein